MPKNTDATATSAWPRFLAAHARLVARIEAGLAQAGLPPLAWYDVLWALEQAPERRLRMSELADRLVISRSNVTRLVDRLVRAKLVRRAATEADGRGASAVLTAKGLEQRAAMWPVYRDGIAERFDRHLSAQEAATLERVFDRMIEADRASG